MTEGVSILVYGDSGIGKTTDVAYTYRKAAWILTEPGGLEPATRCIGFQPSPVFTLFGVDKPDVELRDVLDREILPLAQARKISSVVLDTGSEVADRMVSAWIRKGVDGRRAYGKIANEFLTAIRRLINLKALGIDVICICHEIGPDIDEKTKARSRGGPLMPGRRLPRSLPPKFDMALRADVKQELGVRQRIYRCDPLDPDYIMKDRLGVTLDEQPMELAPIIYRIRNPGKEPPEVLYTKVLATLRSVPTGEASS